MNAGVAIQLSDILTNANVSVSGSDVTAVITLTDNVSTQTLIFQGLGATIDTVAELQTAIQPVFDAA